MTKRLESLLFTLHGMSWVCQAGFTVVEPMLLPSSRNPFQCHEEVLSLQPMIPLKSFDIFPPDWGMLRRSRIQYIYSFSKVSVVCR